MKTERETVTELLAIATGIPAERIANATVTKVELQQLEIVGAQLSRLALYLVRDEVITSFGDAV